jgi:peptidyl-prolyl cis-trans isomerase B (cyclophilin B)
MPKSALVPALAAAVVLLAGCGGQSSSTTEAKDASTSASPTTAGAPHCSYPSDPAGSAGKKVTAPPATPSVSGTVTATVATSIGAIGLSLDASQAPCTVNSFVSLARQGYFDKTSCHRLTTAGIKVLQCGDPSGTGSGGPGYSFDDELSGAEALTTDATLTQQAGQTIKTYPAGTIAMANAGPNTNGSQFFLVYAASPLPPAYTVFGSIDQAGVAAIAKAAQAGTDDSFGQGDGHPKTPVEITSVTIG